MPQVFQVLRCYQCEVFQVHQVKKAKKWECKLCGEKQSVKRCYGVAKECRLHVQKFNGIRGEQDDLKSLDSDIEDDSENVTKEVQKTKQTPIVKSKWSNYVEETTPTESKTADKMYLDNTEIVLEVPKKRRKASFKCPALKTSLNNIQYENAIENTENITRFKSFANKEKQIKTDFHLPKVSINTIAPQPAGTSSSKWNQYVTEKKTELNENSEIEDIHLENSKTVKEHLFSLCDDEDLDNILDI